MSSDTDGRPGKFTGRSADVRRKLERVGSLENVHADDGHAPEPWPLRTRLELIVHDDEVTFVDSGYPKDRDLVEASVREIGRSLSDVTAMLLTHAHVDHIGSAEWLRRDFGVPVHCHTDEAPQARGEIEQRISEQDILIRLWRPGVLMFLLNVVTKGGLNPTHVTEVTTFADGAQLDVPGRPVAVHTPGHTSGHVGFHLPDRGVLISGDALITVDVWDDSNRGPQVIQTPFNHDHKQAIDSLQRFEELEADAVIPRQDSGSVSGSGNLGVAER